MSDVALRETKCVGTAYFLLDDIQYYRITKRVLFQLTNRNYFITTNLFDWSNES